ncbi:MAG: GtrA family protein [Anaerolineae bacterium]|nr:GtrA family protein [Anaerolineae bacterium]
MVDSLRTTITSNRKEVTRFLKFAVVGIIGAIVDFGILYLLHAVLGWPLALANTISFSCAVVSNFTWNRYWTYPDSRSKPITSQLGQFFVVNIAGWAINTGILLLLEGPLTNLAGTVSLVATEALAHKLGYNAAKVFATGVVMFWNFFINRFWTYSDVD